MTSDLTALLDHLIATWESEVVEFKKVTTDYPTSDIGKYFSAMANEANLREVLDDEQKRNKINNLITKLRRAERIRNTGSRKVPQWQIAE